MPSEHILRALAQWGEVALASGYLNNADSKVVQKNVKRLRTTEHKLFALLYKMHPPAVARRLVKLIGGVAGAAYVVGAHGSMTDTARVFFEKSRAKHMRIRRATNVEEQELCAAIKAEISALGGASEHPYKDAEAIRDRVNERLPGRKPVKVDAIARRITALFKNE
jgi:hypothetical protein